MNNYLDNFIKLYTLISPWVVGAVVLFNSVLNGDALWFITLGSAAILLLVAGRIPNFEETKPSPPYCHLITTGSNSAFDLNSLFLSHVATFMLTPCFSNGNKNIGLLLFFIITILTTCISRYTSKCNSLLNIILGLSLGAASGYLFYFIFKDLADGSLVYCNSDTTSSTTTVSNGSGGTTTVSSSEQCYRPSGQKFKCSVYKNGELIQNL